MIDPRSQSDQEPQRGRQVLNLQQTAKELGIAPPTLRRRLRAAFPGERPTRFAPTDLSTLAARLGLTVDLSRPEQRA